MAMQQHDASQAPPTAVSRRRFLLLIGAGLNAIAAALLAAPVLGYVFASFGRKGPSQAWISLGPIDTYPESQTRLATYRNPFTRPWDGKTANIPCWVRRITGEQFQVFAVNCAHLGCPVRWFPQSGLFMCPCHGGAYYRDGSRASGPPERGLFEYPIKIEDGLVTIHAGELPTPASARATAGRPGPYAALDRERPTCA